MRFRWGRTQRTHRRMGDRTSRTLGASPSELVAFTGTRDIEAPVLPKRYCENQGVHRAPRGQACGIWDGDGSEGTWLMEDPVQAAKAELLQATTMSDLVDIAKRTVQEDWMNTMLDFPGNMYRIAAFGKLFYFNPETSFIFDLSRMLGCVLVWLIQFFSPPTLFMAAWQGWGVKQKNVIEFTKGFWDFEDWSEMWATKILSMTFIGAFCLNGVFVVLDELSSWEKMDATFRYLNKNTRSHLYGEGFLLLDAFTNCWVITWCCLCSFFVVGPSETPQEVLFDALGLLFLYNLDDIGGDFGFLNSDDWPGDRIAWMYQNMVEKAKDYTDDYSSQGGGVYTVARTPIRIGYWICVVILCIFVIVMPFMVGVTSFSKTN